MTKGDVSCQVTVEIITVVAKAAEAAEAIRAAKVSKFLPNLPPRRGGNTSPLFFV